MQTNQPQVFGTNGSTGGVESRAGSQGKAELLVFVAGGDEFMCVGLDTRFHPHQHVLCAVFIGSDEVQQLQLLAGINNNNAHAVFYTSTQEIG